MHRARTEPFDGGKMGLRAISLVTVETIHREFFMQIVEQLITVDLCQDRGSRDGNHALVALGEALLRKVE